MQAFHPRDSRKVKELFNNLKFVLIHIKLLFQIYPVNRMMWINDQLHNTLKELKIDRTENVADWRQLGPLKVNGGNSDGHAEGKK